MEHLRFHTCALYRQQQRVVPQTACCYEYRRSSLVHSTHQCIRTSLRHQKFLLPAKRMRHFGAVSILKSGAASQPYGRRDEPTTTLISPLDSVTFLTVSVRVLSNARFIYSTSVATVDPSNWTAAPFGPTEPDHVPASGSSP
jgi:hypothetical protein